MLFWIDIKSKTTFLFLHTLLVLETNTKNALQW
jgi:hypothetical protein